MRDLQAEYDDAMFDYSQGEYDGAIVKLRSILEHEPINFDAQLSIAMCHYRKGDYRTAISEGHLAEKLRPNEQLVHTNLSLFYMKSGDKTTAEKHGLQARIASWKENMAASGTPTTAAENPELQMAQAKAKSFKLPEKFPDMPWKKSSKPAGNSSSDSSPKH